MAMDSLNNNLKAGDNLRLHFYGPPRHDRGLLYISGVSSLDSYSKDSYSRLFLADSTDSRVWALEYESGTR